MSETKIFNIGGADFGKPLGRQNKPEEPSDTEELKKQVEQNTAAIVDASHAINANENEIVRLENEKASLVDVADVKTALSDQKFVALPDENNVYELSITEDTSGFKNGKLTQLKMQLANDTIRFNDSFNDASGEGRIIVIDDRRIEIDRVVISSKAVRVEGNFRDKEALFLQYEAKFLSQA